MILKVINENLISTEDETLEDMLPFHSFPSFSFKLYPIYFWWTLNRDKQFIIKTWLEYACEYVEWMCVCVVYNKLKNTFFIIVKTFIHLTYKAYRGNYNISLDVLYANFCQAKPGELLLLLPTIC